jgi:hypothetical protein
MVGGETFSSAPICAQVRPCAFNRTMSVSCSRTDPERGRWAGFGSGFFIQSVTGSGVAICTGSGADSDSKGDAAVLPVLGVDCSICGNTALGVGVYLPYLAVTPCRSAQAPTLSVVGRPWMLEARLPDDRASDRLPSSVRGMG